MLGIELLAIALLVVVLCFNGYATVRVVRDELTARSQKAAQIILVWLIPFIGAAIVLYIQREERFEVREFEPPNPEQFGGVTPDHGHGADHVL